MSLSIGCLENNHLSSPRRVVRIVVTVSGLLIIFPLSVIFIGFDVSAVNTKGVTALIYAVVVGTYLGMLLSFYNIQRFGATAAVMSAYVIPVIASLTGMLLLGEQITFPMMGGMALIGVGVWMINRG